MRWQAAGFGNRSKGSQSSTDKTTETRRDGMLTELLQRVVLFLFPHSPTATTEFTSTSTSTISAAASFRKRDKRDAVRFSLVCDRRCCRSRDIWHQVIWNMFHVRLHSCRMQRLIVLQVFEIIWVVLKVSLQPPRKSEFRRQRTRNTIAE
jgi:hypothetical protein